MERDLDKKLYKCYKKKKRNWWAIYFSKNENIDKDVAEIIMQEENIVVVFV